MNTTQMTDETRIAALRAFGYTEREAEFLCLAALHGGYFLRRQYRAFLGRAAAVTVGTLIEKTLALQHAKAATFGQSMQVYHLCTRPFYSALGQAHNRNRRDRQISTMKNKIMTLDFVL